MKGNYAVYTFTTMYSTTMVVNLVKSAITES